MSAAVVRRVAIASITVAIVATRSSYAPVPNLTQETKTGRSQSESAQSFGAINMTKIKVSEHVSSVGTQVFVFPLANGRTVEIEFCPHLIDPDGDACCAVVALLGENREKLQIAVNESGQEKKMMNSLCLWFTTPEEDEKNSQMLREELDSIKRHLPNPEEGNGSPA